MVKKKDKVLLGMSGGVDSAVSAILLQEQGYEVYGVTLKLWGQEKVEDAEKICTKLGIEHYNIDAKKEFKEHVIDDFICKYKINQTPNPCIECNKYLKFGYMYELAQKMGIEYLATGHYAKMEYSEKYGRYVIKKANKVIFPLGEIESKEKIREIARNYNLEVANKPDSEDICFIPDGDYKKFLEENSDIQPKNGKIVNTKGEVLGEHQGLYRYTIGQRKGLGIAYSKPLYVIGFNTDKNELIVGIENELYKSEMLVNNLNLLLVDEIPNSIKVLVKTRYSAKEYPATIKMIEKDTIKVKFDNPVARITPGQSAVFYIEDMVLGGGKII